MLTHLFERQLDELKCICLLKTFSYHLHYIFSSSGATACMNCMGIDILILSQIYLYSSYFDCFFSILKEDKNAWFGRGIIVYF